MAAPWQDRVRSKLTSLKAAVSQIRRGEHIFLSCGSAAPLGLIPGLVAEDVGLSHNEIIHLLTLGEAPYTRPEFAERFRHNALFIGPNVRAAVTEGRADYTPVFLSEIPALIRSGRIPIDVAMISVTPPDAAGYCSLGTHVDLAPAVLDVVRLVIAEINPRLPRTNGQSRVHVDRIHALVEADHPLPELTPPGSTEETETIAQHIADLIPDGATLQLGIGTIPDAVVRHLKEHSDLGIHSEMFSDGVVELAQRGVITGNAKKLNPAKIVASFVLGTRKTYDFVNENPTVELYPAEYTNDPYIIAVNDDVIAINTALEIDLTGQVCADSIGARFYSGIGGQVDFIRGAARSKRGKPVIALPSTAQNGVVSRIVPRLADGAGVVTTRGDVHYVVTEYGVADLHGRTIRERAMSLISIAHPKFRPWLLAEAKRRAYVYIDQIEPPVTVPLYPSRLESRATASDCLSLLIRPVRATDERNVHDMFYRFSHETIYQRFAEMRDYLGRESLQAFCTIDYERDMTLVAEVKNGPTTPIAGMALYVLDRRTQYGRLACMVADAYRGRGIATLLVRALADIAQARNLRGLIAEMTPDNTGMRRVLEKMGYPLESTHEGRTIMLKMTFTRASGGAGVPTEGRERARK
ncbi:MAG: GNAT family N-acetyltransferase [Phycisphaerae bacterium]|nr:GNAT family N-acetyltransferase [Phycisphaerae bacterium]NUQ46633.1 GNAT family N-acetyltransferase [Phycisphaerae bacterium]